MLSKVSPRPANSPCTCVWPREHARQQARAQEEEIITARYDTVTSPLSTLATLPETLSAALPTFGSSEKKSGDSPPGTSDGTTLGGSATGYGTVRPLDRNEQARLEREKVVRENEGRLEKKRGTLGKSSMAAAKKPDVMIRQIKKRVARSTENKTRALFSYREDLAILLRSLVPAIPADHHAHPIHNPDMVLCPSCLSTLATGLYFSPARAEEYIGENSTRGFLALVDDAVASLESNMQMENIGHHELARILEGELAVCEWRIATKLARYHKKTDFLNLFPAKVGEFAELRVEAAPPSRPEGIVKRSGKAALRAVGIGGANKATPQSTAVSTESVSV